MKIKKVIVVGATGTIGKTVSAIFASFGNCKVYMLGRDIKKLEKAKHEAALSVKALTIINNLYIDTIDNISNYTKDCDLVFECVSEDIELKKEIHNIINKNVNKDIIISSGTSSISIDELADCYDKDKRKNFIGIHFFNPPYSLPLCELIPSKYNSDNYVNNIKDYLDNTLLRDTIIVKNEPGFLANRIGFMFMNEALEYIEKYQDNGGIDYIDTILGSFTGRSMKVLETIDFVGLDVYKSIIDNIGLKVPKTINCLIKEGSLGNKTNCGLYKDNMVYDIKTNKYREIKKYNISFINKVIKEIANGNYKEAFNIIKKDNSIESNLCITFLLKYIINSIKVTKKLCNDISYCDTSMASGFNWLPPLSLIEVLGGNNEVIKLSKEYLGENIEELVNDLPKSKYDYRKFIKARV